MSLSDISNPLLVLRGYLWDTFIQIDPSLLDTYGTTVPIFPIADTYAGNDIWKNKAYFIYNTVYGRPVDEFYPVKTELVHYSLKGDASQTFQWSRALQFILDRQDDAAKDVNEWNRLYGQSDIFFHNIRVFQVEKSAGRNYITDQNVITDMIVKITYHYTSTIDDIIKA